jgi:hypothetical protein
MDEKISHLIMPKLHSQVKWCHSLKTQNVNHYFQQAIQLLLVFVQYN